MFWRLEEPHVPGREISRASLHPGPRKGLCSCSLRSSQAPPGNFTISALQFPKGETVGQLSAHARSGLLGVRAPISCPCHQNQRPELPGSTPRQPVSLLHTCPRSILLGTHLLLAGPHTQQTSGTRKPQGETLPHSRSSALFQSPGPGTSLAHHMWQHLQEEKKTELPRGRAEGAQTEAEASSRRPGSKPVAFNTGIWGSVWRRFWLSRWGCSWHFRASRDAFNFSHARDSPPCQRTV